MSRLRPQEGLVSGRVGMLAEWVAQVTKEGLQVLLLCSGTLDASKNLANITTIVAVVEERDVLVGAKGSQEFGQGSRALGKLEHKESLIGDIGATAN